MAKIIKKSQSHQEEIFNGTKSQCIEYFDLHDGVLIDENEFEWDLEIID